MKITINLKPIVQAPVDFLNYPLIKEGIKSCAGLFSFACMFVAGHDLYKISQGLHFSTELRQEPRNWQKTAYKATIIMAKVSLVLSGLVSQPGAFLIAGLAGRIFLPQQLKHWFGPAATFAVNPWHPRHVISIAAVILALPSCLLSAYEGGLWATRQLLHLRTNVHSDGARSRWLSDSKLKLLTLLNTALSRPVIHYGNYLSRQLLR